MQPPKAARCTFRREAQGWRGRCEPGRGSQGSGVPGPSPSGTSGEGALSVSRPRAWAARREQSPRRGRSEEARGGAAASVAHGGSFLQATSTPTPAHAERSGDPALRPPRRTEPGARSHREDSPLPRRRVPVPQPSYLSPGAAWRTELAGLLRRYPPQPGRLAWPCGTPAEVGLYLLDAAGFLPTHLTPPRPPNTHPQSW